MNEQVGMDGRTDAEREASLQRTFAMFDSEPTPEEIAAREARRAAKAAQARELMAQPQPWDYQTWRTLQRLGFATIQEYDGGESEHGWWGAGLTLEGERLLDPTALPNDLYADATERDYIQRAR